MDHISIWMEEDLPPPNHRNMLLGYILTLTLRAKLIQPPTIRENLLKAEKAEMPPDAWAKVCIYRVPKPLRDVNPHAFNPQMVSIGPYHRHKEGLNMDIHKRRCFHRIIGRSKLDEVFVFDSIREVVSDARSCYEGTIQLSDEEFVETMVLDGCFLLEIFWGFLNGFESLGYSPYDPVFSFGIALEFIRADVKRLENQVPLFILERLLGMITNEMKDKKDQVIRLALCFFGVPKSYFDPLKIRKKYRKCVHCLDIYRRSFLDFEPIPQQTSSKFKKLLHLITAPFNRNTSNLDPPNNPPTRYVTIPCVTKLRQAGIKFKKRETKCFFDIKFEAETGVLHIPMLLLDDNIVKREFPNLIAFEQCHYFSRRNNHVTSYARFMDDLIDSPDDVAYLHDCGIIDPFGGGSYKETADFFNSIVNEVIIRPSPSYLSEVTTHLSEEVKRYNESTIRKLTVKFKRRYFSNPWSVIALFAAIFGLVLTFFATFYAMYGYYKPRSLIAWLM